MQTCPTCFNPYLNSIVHECDLTPNTTQIAAISIEALDSPAKTSCQLLTQAQRLIFIISLS